MKIVVKKGMVMFCHNCNKNIYKVNRDIWNYERISPEPLDGIPPIEKPMEYVRLNCPYCGNNFYYNIILNFRNEEVLKCI